MVSSAGSRRSRHRALIIKPLAGAANTSSPRWRGRSSRMIWVRGSGARVQGCHCEPTLGRRGNLAALQSLRAKRSNLPLGPFLWEGSPEPDWRLKPAATFGRRSRTAQRALATTKPRSATRCGAGLRFWASWFSSFHTTAIRAGRWNRSCGASAVARAPSPASFRRDSSVGAGRCPGPRHSACLPLRRHSGGIAPCQI